MSTDDDATAFERWEVVELATANKWITNAPVASFFIMSQSS